MMSRILLISCLLTCAVWINLTAQVKHDANWTFGYKGGINFSNLDSVYTYETNALNSEAVGCISDSLGELLFYISEKKNVFEGYEILNSLGNRFSNNDDIKSYGSCTNGILILPLSFNKYYIFHISLEGNITLNLYYSIVSGNSNTLKIDTLNVPLYKLSSLEEKITAVKHANGKDWWLYVSEGRDSISQSCSNLYIRFLVTIEGEILGPYFQNVGTNRCNVGAMKISKLGNKACAAIDGHRVDIYDIDRCTGELTYITYSPGQFAYDCEFSLNENNLYTTFVNYRDNGNPANNSYIRQYNLLNGQTSLISVFYAIDSSFGQLEIAPNNVIYVSKTNTSYSPGTYSYFRTLNTLDVINEPDSLGLACNFQPYSFILADSSRAKYGLPNFPNYNLGALSIYEADAGRDTVICTDSTINQKVVQLGSSTINGVQYQWYPNYNLSSDTVAQPLAYPDTSTWYYVMLSDTTIKNACKTRLDSVWVEVRKCNTGIENEMLKESKKHYIIPNPIGSEMKGIINLEKEAKGKVTIYNATGIKVYDSHLESGANILYLKELSSGVYLYNIWVNGQLNNQSKLVIMQ